MPASIQYWQDGPCAHVVHTETPAEPVGENGTTIGIAAPQPMHFQAVSKLLNHRHWRFRVCGFGFDYATVPHVACDVQRTVPVVRPFEALDFPFSQSCEAGHTKTSGCWFRKDGENRLDFFKGIGIGFGGRSRVTESYLGVMFVGGPDTLEPGDSASVKLALMYFPEYPYEEVQPGVTFTVREGPLIVGYGVIQSRGMQTLPLPMAQAE